MASEKNKILVVEDDDDMRNILVDRLKTLARYEILQAADGQQAVDIAIEQKPNLILLDLLLPKMDGFGVLEKVRHSTDADVAQAKVIVLSNLWSNKDILRAQDLKIEEYYVKANTNLEDVLTKVSQIMAGNN